MSILRRYLLKEVGIPLLVWLGFLFGLLLVMQLLKGTDVLLGSSVTLLDFGRLLLFLTPHFLVVALPVAFLLAILLGIGRMNEDRELVALSGMGVSPLKVAAVPLGMSVLLGLILLVLSAQGDPWGQARARRAVSEIIKRNVIGDVKPRVFYEDIPALTLYAERVDVKAGKWTNVMVHDDRDPKAPLLVLAREGAVATPPAGDSLYVELKDGTVHRTEHAAVDYTVVSFQNGTLTVGMVDSIVRNDRFRTNSQADMTPGDLLAAARDAERRKDDPRSYLTAYHSRFAQGWTPVAFALLGAPLAIWRQKGRGQSYFFALMGYVAYYVLSHAFENWGAIGRVPPWLGAWGCNLLFCLVGAAQLTLLARGGQRR